MPQKALDFFGSIPASFWSAFWTATVAFLGVYIANRGNTKRLIRQLQHDSEEKARDRLHMLRREVCLKAAEELVHFQIALSQISQLELTDPKLLDPVRNFGAAAARLQLVTGPTTALQVYRLAFEYQHIYMNLIGYAAPVASARIDSQIAKQWLETYNGEIMRISGDMRKFRESGTDDQVVRNALSSSYEFYAAQRDKYQDDMNRHLALVNSRTLEFNRQLLLYLIAIVPQHNDLLVELRRDLGLNTDLDRFEELSRQQTREALEYYENALDLLQSAFETSDVSPDSA